jgi:hypothetical protein
LFDFNRKIIFASCLIYSCLVLDLSLLISACFLISFLMLIFLVISLLAPRSQFGRRRHCRPWILLAALSFSRFRFPLLIVFFAPPDLDRSSAATAPGFHRRSSHLGSVSRTQERWFPQRPRDLASAPWKSSPMEFGPRRCPQPLV